MKPTHYQLLRLPTDASAADIDAAFLDLCRAARATGHDAIDGVSVDELRHAYAVLCDPEQRAAYDAENRIVRLAVAPERKDPSPTSPHELPSAAEATAALLAELKNVDRDLRASDQSKAALRDAQRTARANPFLHLSPRDRGPTEIRRAAETLWRKCDARVAADQIFVAIVAASLALVTTIIMLIDRRSSINGVGMFLLMAIVGWVVAGFIFVIAGRVVLWLLELLGVGSKNRRRIPALLFGAWVVLIALGTFFPRSANNENAGQSVPLKTARAGKKTRWAIDRSQKAPDGSPILLASLPAVAAVSGGKTITATLVIRSKQGVLDVFVYFPTKLAGTLHNAKPAAWVNASIGATTLDDYWFSYSADEKTHALFPQTDTLDLLALMQRGLPLAVQTQTADNQPIGVQFELGPMDDVLSAFGPAIRAAQNEQRLSALEQAAREKADEAAIAARVDKLAQAAGRHIMASYGGGRDLVVTTGKWQFDSDEHKFRIFVSLRFNGAIWEDNRYWMTGFLIVREDGTDARFAKESGNMSTWSNSLPDLDI